MKKLIPLSSRTRAQALDLVSRAPEGWTVLISEPTRTAEQNAMLWPMLECFARQIAWPVNGRMTLLTKEDWKDLLTAAFHQEGQRVSPSLTGVGMVLLGRRTSGFGKKEFSEFIDYVQYQAGVMGVELGERENGDDLHRDRSGTDGGSGGDT